MRRAPSARGTRAPLRRAPAARTPSPRAPRSSARRVRRGHGRAPRAAAARPRASSSSSAAAVRRGGEQEAAPGPSATRAATAAEGSAGGAASSCATRSRHGDDEVEAVEQRPRELVAEGCEALRGAGALDRRVAAAAARAEVHRRHELEAGREERHALRAGDADDAVLERLAQRLERRPHELGQLVEQQDAVVREARFAGTRPGPAADDGRDRGAVVGRPKGRRRDQRPPGKQQARPPSGSA